MAQTQVYTLERFVEDSHDIYKASTDALSRAQGVAENLRRLLAVPGWIEERLNLPAEGGFGTYCLHQDTEYGHPQPGFTFLVHVTPARRQSGAGSTGAPHDHGPCFVVYGMYVGSTIQRKYRWTGADAQNHTPKMEEYVRFPQLEKETAFFLPGEIHSPMSTTEGPRSILVRVTSQDLAQVWRHRYSLSEGGAELIRTSD